MGKEFIVNSLEDMCDLMCNNIVPGEKEHYWIFTFGHGQQNEGKYVRIKGTYGSARDQMIDRFGTEWAFQYSEEEWNEYKSDPNRWWPLETELLD